MSNSAPSPRPAGYLALLSRYRLEAIPHWHQSWIAGGNVPRRLEIAGGVTTETYPAKYWPGDGVTDHLEFALKYDGINLATLSLLFETLSEQELVAYVEFRPTGKYARKLWFLFEFLTGRRLPLADIKRGSYVDMLDPEAYYTSNATKVRRQRINDNLLGSAALCPIVRRSESLTGFDAAALAERCLAVTSAYPPELLRRALSYLYSKETKSSFEIEHITPNASRTERFIAQLKLAERQDFCDKEHLIDLQNRIVDPRFADTDYRSSQNYIGESITIHRERVHYVCPKPEDVPSMMQGLIETHARFETSDLPVPVQAAVIAWGFVYIHPFEDGNGRIHRFLIHNILARRGFTPEGLMFPVSAAMLKHPADYDASLEAFSRPLLPLVEFTLDDDGHMTVDNRTDRWYRYLDLTTQAEALYRFIEQTIDTELTQELSFLASYDEAKRNIQAIVDMPDRKIDLFIRVCRENGWRLSKRKSREFDALTAEEILALETVVRQSFARGQER